MTTVISVNGTVAIVGSVAVGSVTVGSVTVGPVAPVAIVSSIAVGLNLKHKVFIAF